MNDKFLVTGATGFIGSNLVRRLIKEKKDVSVIVRDKALNWRLKDIIDHIKVYTCDISDPRLGAIVKKISPDFIFHTATYGVYPKQKDRETLIDVNLRGTINIVEACKSIGFKLFVNTGSCFEYGVKEEKMKESDLLAPINDYGIIKAATTLFCQKEGVVNKLPIITLRLFTGYGYYEDGDRLISSSILSALKDNKLELSSPENARNFTFTEDIVDAYLMASKNSFIPGEIFNIASREPHTIEEVVNLILKLTKSKSKIFWMGDKKQHWEIEPLNWNVDISKAQSFGWQPRYDLDKGLKKAVEWYKKFYYLYS